MNLQELKVQEKELLSQLSVNCQAQRQIYIEMFYQKYRLKVGDKIEYNNYSGVISGFSFSGYDNSISAIIAKKINKDGSLSLVENKLCSYSQIKKLS